MLNVLSGSSVRTSPQKMMRPLGGVRLYFFKRCWVLVMADKTESLLTRDLMHDAVPYSSVSILLVRLISCLALRIKVIAEVPLPRAASNIFTNRLTFHCSICLSSSDMASDSDSDYSDYSEPEQVTAPGPVLAASCSHSSAI